MLAAKVSVTKMITMRPEKVRKRTLRKGQTLVEYALILAFISIVVISVLINLGDTLRATFSRVNSQIVAAQASH